MFSLSIDLITYNCCWSPNDAKIIGETLAIDQTKMNHLHKLKNVGDSDNER